METIYDLMSKIMNLMFMNIKGFINSDIVAKILALVIAWMIFLLPYWIALLLYNVFTPDGTFFKVLMILILCLVFGYPQIIFCIIGVGFTLTLFDLC